MSHMPSFVTSSLASEDAKSGKLRPKTSAEWNRLLAYINDSTGGPTSYWLFQDHDTAAVDVNAKHTLTPTIAGASYCSFQNPLAGWDSLSVGTVNHTGTDIGFVKQHGTLPDPAAKSYLQIGYVWLSTAPTNGLDWGFMSTTDGAIYVGIKNGTAYPTTGSASGEISRGSQPLPIGSMFPIALKHDITRNIVKAYLPNEVLCQTFVSSGANTGEVDFGVAAASGLYASNAYYNYGALFIGAAAEKSDATIGALLTAMGWQIGWWSPPAADPTTKKFYPGATLQWQSLGIVPPQNCWPLQESAGVSANDIINDCLLVSQAGVTNGNASGSRMALKTTDGLATSYAGSTDSRLGSPATKSQALLVAATITAATTGSASYWSWVAGFDSIEFNAIEVTTAGKMLFYQDGNWSNPGNLDHRGAEHLFLLVYNFTAQTSTLYTDLEKIAGPTFTQDANTAGVFVGSHSGIPSCGELVDFLASYAGPAAEFDDTAARDLFTRLGWTVPW